MTLKEAIEILTIWREEGEIIDSEKLDKAEKLGIEAGKHIEHNRLVNNHPDQALLPGETKE